MRRTLVRRSDGSVRRVAATAKRLEYAVSVGRAGDAHSALGGSTIEREEEWSAEHLVLAGLCRCTQTSLEYHARRANVRATSDVRAHGVVTKRESDGRYAFVELDVELDAVLDPPLAGENLRALLQKAERDCFVGASLTAPPRYHWTVEGEEIG
jgi:organic hydroperoxide reductase OsmC/OhrA